MFYRTVLAVDFADRILNLADDLARWSQQAFGPDAVRGPHGGLKHLEREARQAFAAIGTESFAEEMADCLLLVLDASRRGGVPIVPLISAAVVKLKVNEARNWPQPTSDEPVEHIWDSDNTRKS